MTAPTVNVTVSLFEQDGAPVVGATVTAKLDVNDIYGGYVVPDTVTGTTNSSGVAVLACFPNKPAPDGLGQTGSTYRFTARNAVGKKVLDVFAQVPNLACNLHEIALYEPLPGVQALQGPKGDAATLSLGAIATGVPGTDVIIANVGTSGDAILNITIPRGNPGFGTTPATSVDPGTMSAADFTKLAGIATGATANSADGTLLSRINHTGSQLASTISDFAAATRSTVLAGLSTAAATVVDATHTVLQALGFLQKQVSDNLATLSGHTSNTGNPHGTTAAQVGLGSVSNLAPADMPVSTAQAAADIAARDAAKAYADTLVVGLVDDRGNFDASVNAYPSSGGSGMVGAILKGDLWTVSVAGTLPTAKAVTAGDLVRALMDAPGNTQANWAITENNIGYVAEASGTAAAGDSAHLGNFAHGDIAHTNRAALNLVSGANTGDQTAATVPNTAAGNISATTVQGAINELDAEKQGTLISGTNIRMVNGESLLGASNLVILGLTNFTESINTAAPNATVPVVSITPNNAATNVDVALAPKGTGTLTAHVADSAATGGDKRGANAVDWQTKRNSSVQVASGTASVIAGGADNRADSSYAFVGGGLGNLASGLYAVAMGWANNSGNSYATISGGRNNLASGVGATVCGGEGNVANGNHAAVPGGFRANAGTVTGKYAFASGMFGAAGDCQRGSLTLRRATADATALALSSTGDAPDSANQLILVNNQAMVVRGQVICRRSVAQANEAAAWEFTCIITRGANAAATALVSPAVITSVANNIASLPATPFTITADTTNGALAVTVTGLAATNLRWLCTATTSELIYA